MFVTFQFTGRGGGGGGKREDSGNNECKVWSSDNGILHLHRAGTREIKIVYKLRLRL